MAKKDAKVVLSDINVSAAERVAAEIAQSGGIASAVQHHPRPASLLVHPVIDI